MRMRGRRFTCGGASFITVNLSKQPENKRVCKARKLQIYRRLFISNIDTSPSGMAPDWYNFHSRDCIPGRHFDDARTWQTIEEVVYAD